ncbi:hypothetical protein EDB85DRAFT_1894168 [Lactarius pseudohatsudake]|nr:hypothetical protein EDB85DRAFT_1894168 [Lactarius pseudohatsudake]
MIPLQRYVTLDVATNGPSTSCCRQYRPRVRNDYPALPFCVEGGEHERRNMKNEGTMRCMYPGFNLVDPRKNPTLALWDARCCSPRQEVAHLPVVADNIEDLELETATQPAPEAADPATAPPRGVGVEGDAS